MRMSCESQIKCGSIPNHIVWMKQSQSESEKALLGFPFDETGEESLGEISHCVVFISVALGL